MTYDVISCSLVFCFCVCLTLVTLTVADQECNKNACLGPVAHYESLGCKAHYEYYNINPPCCPWLYDCDYLYTRARSKSKCYFKGNTGFNEYGVGEKLKERDTNICEEDCTCTFVGDGVADFKCTHRDELCPEYKPSKDGCFQVKSHDKCCSSEEYCLESGETRGTCKIDGRTYLAGDLFAMRDNSGWRRCVCHPERVGSKKTENLPICIEVNRPLWKDLHSQAYFYKKCAPVYLPSLNIKYGIGLYRKTWRCQKDNDTIWDPDLMDSETFEREHGPFTAMFCDYHSYGITSFFRCVDSVVPCRLVNPEGPPGVTYGLSYYLKCQFGQKTLHIGDHLNDIAYGNDSCIICACEVPPTLTCILLEKVSCRMYRRRGVNIFDERKKLYFQLSEEYYPRMKALQGIFGDKYFFPRYVIF